MSLRIRNYIFEGKSVSIVKPERPPTQWGPDKTEWRKWKSSRLTYAKDVKRAVKSIFTWTNEKFNFVSQYSVIRIVGGNKRKNDWIFQIYDVDPDSKDKKRKLKVNVRKKGFQDTIDLGIHGSVTKARRVALEWAIDRALKSGAEMVKRVSLRG
jgi:hypothetical protein